ncbi:MAG: hypothetical protein HYZ48_02580, partial [Chlamydiales bacterium]|nr:hypothetical protein [Chlamydiales bacterium]
DKIEIWPKAEYEKQLSALIADEDEEVSLAKLTEEAFALLDAEQVSPLQDEKEGLSPQAYTCRKNSAPLKGGVPIFGSDE